MAARWSDENKEFLMPTYCFVNATSFVHRVYPISKCPRTIRVEGKSFTKAVACLHRDRRVAGQGNGKWPIYSEAAAVHPDQIEEAKEHCRRSGVPTEYDNLGRPKLDDPAHRRKFNKAWGYFDKAGYD